MIAPPNLAGYPTIEVRGFKWPGRPTANARAYLLGADGFGRWLGVAKGAPWRSADGTRSGTFDLSFVKLVPDGTFWTACFHQIDPVVDVDIVLPVRWLDGALEETDLELDILRSAAGAVSLRDRDAFERVRRAGAMPDTVAAQAEATCARIRALVAAGAEPFGNVGRTWLDRFLAIAPG